MTVDSVASGGIVSSSWGNDVAAAINLNTAATEFTYTTTAPTAGTGWSIDAFEAYYSSTFMVLKLTVERTGTAITVPTTGNFTNELVATLDAEVHGTSGFDSTLGGGGSGRVTSGYINPNTGEVRLSAVAGSANVATNDVLELSGFVFLGVPV